MLKRLHPIAGALALTIILGFWSATVLSELFAGPATIAAVKTAIPWGFVLLVPSLIFVGGTGHRMGATWRHPAVDRKRRRMPFIAANGIVILIPSAVFLAFKARSGSFDGAFYAVQALELAAGLVNIVLLGLSLRDGLRLRRKPRTAWP